MSYSSEDETDISDSELDEYVDRCYEQLKDDVKKVKYADRVYKCPYCPGKKKIVYAFKDLLQHAIDVGKGSCNRDIKHKGKHLCLVKFLKNEINHEDNISSELAALSLDHPSLDSETELFVFPWMGILANVDSEESISRLKSDLVKKGFSPVRVRLLRDGYAIVEFKREWSGFYNAMMFEKQFEVGKLGKKDYSSVSVLGDGIYGWVARDDDYSSSGALGEYFQKNGDLKTIAAVEGDAKRKTGLLVANLNKTIEELRMRVDELECNGRGSLETR